MKKSVLFVLSIFLIISTEAQNIDKNLLEAVHYRSIGPTRQGGRYVDFAVVNKNPTTFYAALDLRKTRRLLFHP